MSDRGMKKWAPFASLIEQSAFLEEMKYQKNKQEKPRIAKERIEKINKILSNYHNEEVTITYFYDGYLYNFKGVINKIDSLNKKVFLECGEIPFIEIIDINSDEILEEEFFSAIDSI